MDLDDEFLDALATVRDRLGESEAATATIRGIRDHYVRRIVAAGVAVASIAQVLGVSRQAVRKILVADDRVNDRPIDGCDRCSCGGRLWDDDARCLDCGEAFDAEAIR